jgi:DNA-directed RNA polymerase specialized sigma24 family protein
MMNQPIEVIYSENRRDLINRAQGLVHNWADAEDAVQESFLRTIEWSNQHGKEAVHNPVDWLRACARRAAVNILKSRGRHHEKRGVLAWCQEAAYEMAMPSADIDALVQSAVEQLTPAEQRHLAQSGKTVRERVARCRALKRLREILKRTQAYKEGVLTTCA